jgi:hypothetical protein
MAPRFVTVYRPIALYLFLELTVFVLETSDVREPFMSSALRTSRGDRLTAVPSVGTGVTGAARPSARQRYACGHGLGMMLRKSSKKFEELPPGLVKSSGVSVPYWPFCPKLLISPGMSLPNCQVQPLPPFMVSE